MLFDYIKLNARKKFTPVMSLTWIRPKIPIDFFFLRGEPAVRLPDRQHKNNSYNIQQREI